MVIGVSSWTTSLFYQERVNTMFRKNLLLNELVGHIEDVDEELFLYLSTKNSANLNQYMFHTETLLDFTSKLEETITIYSEEDLMLLDIGQMILAYVETSEVAVDYKRKSNVDGYKAAYDEMLNLRHYIDTYIDELNNRQLDRNAISYDAMAGTLDQINLYNMIFIIDLLAISFILVIKTSNRMIKPIINLSHAAEDLSKGKYAIEDVQVKTNDEVELLAYAFNKMKHSIQSHILELHEKAETEAKLKDQELENLKMQNLLKQSHLFALQSQMNPHFLFNTINAAVQLSKIEGAPRTNEFLESMSRLFRYNVKEADIKVTLENEVENIKDYLSLLSVRFGDMIEYEFDLDQSGLDVKIPPLTLQPLVENAYMHGLSNRESKGHLMVQVIDRHIEVEVKIIDDGIGMSAETIEKILNQETSSGSGSTGIGLLNVIERLEMFYGKKDIFEIESTLGEGTTITLLLQRS